MTPDEKEEEFEKTIEAGMRKLGYLIPETEDEVLASEKSLADADIELPESLKNPMEILTRGLNLDYRQQHPSNDEVENDFKMAARNGKKLDERILEILKNDRNEAEKKHNDINNG